MKFLPMAKVKFALVTQVKFWAVAQSEVSPCGEIKKSPSVTASRATFLAEEGLELKSTVYSEGFCFFFIKKFPRPLTTKNKKDIIALTKLKEY